MVLSGMVWYGIVWYGMVWYGTGLRSFQNIQGPERDSERIGLLLQGHHKREPQFVETAVWFGSFGKDCLLPHRSLNHRPADTPGIADGCEPACKMLARLPGQAFSASTAWTVAKEHNSELTFPAWLGVVLGRGKLHSHHCDQDVLKIFCHS